MKDMHLLSKRFRTPVNKLLITFDRGEVLNFCVFAPLMTRGYK